MYKKTIRIFYMMAVMVSSLFFGTFTVKAAESKTVYGDFGRWTDSTGTVWLYAEKGADEAAVYGVENAMLQLEIPSYVYDETGTGRKVTAAIGISEAENTGYYGEAEESFLYSGRNTEYEPYSISFPNTVSYIGGGAFNAAMYDDEDEDSDIPSSGGHWQFLASVVLPQNPLLVIEDCAFLRCMNLQQVTFRAEIVKAQPAEIKSWAFAYCPKLTKISFPDNSKIEPDALEGCGNLKEVINAPWALEMGETCALEKISYANGEGTFNGLYMSGSKTNNTLKEVTLPEGVTEIGYFAFRNCTALTTINLPEGLKTIESEAFYGCTSLNSFTTLPSTLESIGSKAFMGCENLHLSVTYPAGQNWYTNEFKNSGITDISFSNKIQNIHWEAFRGCKNLNSIYVESGNSRYYSVDGVLYCNYSKFDSNGNITGRQTGLMIYPAGKSHSGSYTIPNHIKVLGGFAFESCKFTEIRIPATVEAFGGGWGDNGEGGFRFYGVFDDMASECVLYMVENSYADYHADVAWLCEHRYMPGNSAKITYKLNGGTNHAGNPTTFVGGSTIWLKNPTRAGYTFTGWQVEDAEKDYTGWWKDDNAATNQYTPAQKELINGVTFVAGWKKNSSSSGSAKTISDADYKLNSNGTAEYKEPLNADSITSVTVPDQVKLNNKTYKVTIISKKAFAKCKKIKSVVIGKNVKEIGAQAFSGCNQLKKITVKSKQLHKVGKKAFKGIHKKAKIKVPKAKAQIYKKLLKGKGQAKSVKITK